MIHWNVMSPTSPERRTNGPTFRLRRCTAVGYNVGVSKVSARLFVVRNVWLHDVRFRPTCGANGSDLTACFEPASGAAA